MCSSDLAELQEAFWKEAARNGILPIHSQDEGAAGKPSLIAGQKVLTYYSGTVRVPESTAPQTLRRSYTIDADVTIPAVGANGVMVTQGGRYGGFAFYLHDGKPVFFYNALGPKQYRVEAPEKLGPGDHKITAAFGADAGKASGTMVISVDGREVARGRIEQTMTAWLSHTEGFDVGEDTLTPVNDDYTIAASKFSGALKRVTFTLE